MGKIKILIADDHAVVREGTRQILEQAEDLVCVGEACDGEEAIRLTGSARPDVAIIDVNMPRVDGVEATKQIKKLYPNTAILILTAYDDDQFVFSLLEAGAAGYLLKSVRGRELVEAVRRVYSGESVLHPAVARKVLNRFVSSSGKPAGEELSGVLSAREMEVLRLAAKGLSNQDIANELCLSLRTVQGHLGHVFNKLQVSSRTEAVVRAIKEGWVTVDDLG
ncbi:MAG: response regulator transcription factor [Chloroflexi bacterium]|nr:response regulator transcription factor [Chloroflexota bacterium]MBM3165921.1 response regulator transcription factor [Chloroflexota bacterium]